MSIHSASLFNEMEQIDTKTTSLDDVPSLNGKSLRSAVKSIPSSFKSIKVYGHGRVVRQDPVPGPKAVNVDSITLWLE